MNEGDGIASINLFNVSLPLLIEKQAIRTKKEEIVNPKMNCPKIK